MSTFLIHTGKDLVTHTAKRKGNGHFVCNLQLQALCSSSGPEQNASLESVMYCVISYNTGVRGRGRGKGQEEGAGGRSGRKEQEGGAGGRG